jgi:ankyrin repeat protein
MPGCLEWQRGGSEKVCSSSHTHNFSNLLILTPRFLPPTLTIEQINTPNSRGQTALFCAARNGHVDVMHLLLNLKGIAVDVQVARQKKRKSERREDERELIACGIVIFSLRGVIFFFPRVSLLRVFTGR